nr:FAD binding domain-containing protein [Streptomyces boncukensis]
MEPRTVEDTVRILAESNGVAALLAGGQSLLPLLNHRRIRPRAVVDLNRVPGLDSVRLVGGSVRIGALTRLRALEAHAALADVLPVLPQTVRLVAYPQIRSRGTLGGSLCHADPAAELPALAMALGARLRLAAQSGERTVEAAAFYHPRGGTTLRPGELLTEVEFPPAERFRWRFEEVPRAGQRGLPLVGACAGVVRDTDGTVTRARFAGSGVAARPVRLPEGEHALVGGPLTAATARAAAEAAAASAAPPSDAHGSGDYRRALLRTTLQRALDEVRS